MDNIANLTYTLVATAPSPATSGTTLIVTSGAGSYFPTPPFDLLMWPANTIATRTNSEIARCTGVSTDTLTIVRGAYSTTAQSVAIGWSVGQTESANLYAQWGGAGTPDSATVALTASTQVVVPGTKVLLPTNDLKIGSTFAFSICMLKTAAGSATWTAKVCFGTAGTNSDGAIATWTSGTNSGVIDKAMLDIIVRVTALGSGTSATALCQAQYVNSLTSTTGFGDLPMIPGSTAGFNSIATTPYIHLDITMGSSAVVTAVGNAERLN